MSVSKGFRGNRADSDSLDNLGKFNSKPRFNWFALFSYQGFCFVVFLIFIAIVIYLTICFAKTGLVEIPFFTPLFYKTPEPISVVNPSSNFILKDKFDLSKVQNNQLDVTLFESELSSLVSNNDRFSKAQIVISDKEMELFAQGNLLMGKSGYITVKFIPIITNNQLDYRLINGKIGQLDLPVFLLNISKNVLLDLTNSQLSFLKDFKLTDAQIKKGELILTVRPL